MDFITECSKYHVQVSNFAQSLIDQGHKPVDCFSIIILGNGDICIPATKPLSVEIIDNCIDALTNARNKVLTERVLDRIAGRVSRPDA